LHDLSELNIVIDAIAVQEIWDIRYPELVNIPGFNPLLFRKRTGMRGGGGCVEFYVRENQSATIIEELSPFENKIFESITIKLYYPSSSKSVLLTSAYRSNGPILNVLSI
jgi:hypothetical protein